MGMGRELCCDRNCTTGIGHTQLATIRKMMVSNSIFPGMEFFAATLAKGLSPILHLMPVGYLDRGRELC